MRRDQKYNYIFLPGASLLASLCTGLFVEDIGNDTHKENASILQECHAEHSGRDKFVTQFVQDCLVANGIEKSSVTEQFQIGDKISELTEAADIEQKRAETFTVRDFTVPAGSAAAVFLLTTWMPAFRMSRPWDHNQEPNS